MPPLAYHTMKAGTAHRYWLGGRQPGATKKKAAGRVRKSCLFIGSLSVLLQDALGWWIWETAPVPEEPIPFNLTIRAGAEAGWDWLDGGILVDGVVGGKPGGRSSAEPEQWDSGSCMDSWGVEELQREVDPRGYIVFSEGREQLGNNRFLLSDGIVIAQALDRTLVEFPMKDSRIATADSVLGFCAYWNCDRLCSYHRILDIPTFRSMLQEGLIQSEDFIDIVSADREQTLMPSLVTAGNITHFFEEYDMWQVIVMKMAWKSGLRREPVDLLRPNPFYLDLVESLLQAQKGWENGQHMAVQWRTETSTGNLSRCYERYVVPAIEEQRQRLGFERDQVYFNTDLVGQASTTYNSSERDQSGTFDPKKCNPYRGMTMWYPGQVVQANRGVVDRIRKDYPAAMDNAVYDCLEKVQEALFAPPGECEGIVLTAKARGSLLSAPPTPLPVQDAGVKAMISGLVSASSSFLLSSSFNSSGTNECQKPHSKYIDLVAEWRFDMLDKYFESVGQIFPSLEEETAWGSHGAIYLAALMGMIALVGVLVTKTGAIGRAKMMKVS